MRSLVIGGILAGAGMIYWLSRRQENGFILPITLPPLPGTSPPPGVVPVPPVSTPSNPATGELPGAVISPVSGDWVVYPDANPVQAVRWQLPSGQWVDYSDAVTYAAYHGIVIPGGSYDGESGSVGYTLDEVSAVFPVHGLAEAHAYERRQALVDTIAYLNRRIQWLLEDINRMSGSPSAYERAQVPALQLQLIEVQQQLQVKMAELAAIG